MRRKRAGFGCLYPEKWLKSQSRWACSFVELVIAARMRPRFKKKLGVAPIFFWPFGSASWGNEGARRLKARPAGVLSVERA
jgi:hypothetical protein